MSTETADTRRMVTRRTILCAGIVALTVYVLTAAPSLTWAHWGTDGGDFVTAAVSGRVPHPPGFPVYFWLSRLAVSVIPGDPARVLNLFSALMACGAVALTAATVCIQGGASLVAVTTALTVAFAPWMWSQALITEVYTCAAFFAGLTFFLVEFASDNDRRVESLVGLSFGLLLSVHLTGIFLLPAIAMGRRRAWRRFTLGAALGLLPYALLPVSGAWPQPWGDLRSIRGWVAMVSARMYWGNAFSLAAAYLPQRALAWLVSIVRQFTPVGALLAMVGLAESRRDSRVRVLGSVVTFALAGAYAIGYNSADSWVYLVATLPLMALAVAAGLRWLTKHGIPSSVGLLLPLVLLVTNWQQMDVHTEQAASLWLAGVLVELPSEAVVVTETDQHTFALWYAVIGTQERSDLVVVDRRLWGYAPYNEFLAGRGLSSPATTDVSGIVASIVGDRPFCEIDTEGGVTCR